MESDNMALMISDLIGQAAQLELFAKYGIKPNLELCAAIHDKYYKEAKPEPEKLEAQVAVNTQRDIDIKKLASKKRLKNYNKATFYNEVVEKLDAKKEAKPEPEKPKRTWRNLIKLFHDNEPKHKPEGYSHEYRR